MKYLLVLLVVVAVFWLMSSRRREVGQSRRSSSAPASPQAMVSCVQCGVHLPRNDALQACDGRWFCSTAHLKAGEARNARGGGR